MNDSRDEHIGDLQTDKGSAPTVGDKVYILWDDENVIYPVVGHSEADDGTVTIHCDNGDVEKDIDMTNVSWSFSSESNPLTTSSSKLSAPLKIQSAEGSVLTSMMEHYGNKAFMKH